MIYLLLLSLKHKNVNRKLLKNKIKHNNKNLDYMGPDNAVAIFTFTAFMKPYWTMKWMAGNAERKAWKEMKRTWSLH